MKRTGSFQTWAMFMDSWKAPILTVPSPKKTVETRPLPSSWAESPAPTAAGSPPPTIPAAPISPRSISVKCMEPPSPVHIPVSRPKSSA